MKYSGLLLSLCLLLPSTLMANDNFTYSTESDRYTVDMQGMPIAYVLNKFAHHSGIGIEYDKRLTTKVDMFFDQVPDSTIIRWLETEFSSIKGLDVNGKVLTLKILPKGQFQSQFLISATDAIAEGLYHAEGKSSLSAQQRYKERFQQLEDKMKRHQEQQIQAALERKALEQARKDERKKRDQEERKEVESELARFKENDPEIYQRLLEVNRVRFPDLGKVSADN